MIQKLLGLLKTFGYKTTDLLQAIAGGLKDGEKIIIIKENETVNIYLNGKKVDLEELNEPKKNASSKVPNKN